MMGLFGPPDVEKAKRTGQIEVMLRAANYKKDPAVAAAGREALGEHIELLIKELHSKNIRRLQVAREALVAVGPPARDRLIFILGEGHVHRRQDAAYVLGEMKDEEAVAPLCESLKHTNSLLRMLSAQALGKIGSRKALRALNMATLDDDPAVVKEARKALAKIPGAGTGLSL
jgi:HEAT repeat protein